MLEGVVHRHGQPFAGIGSRPFSGKGIHTVIPGDAIKLVEPFVIDADFKPAGILEGMRHDFRVHRQIRVVTVNAVAQHLMKRQEPFPSKMIVEKQPVSARRIRRKLHFLEPAKLGAIHLVSPLDRLPFVLQPGLKRRALVSALAPVLGLVGQANAVQRGMTGDQRHQCVQPRRHDGARVGRLDTELEKPFAALAVGGVRVSRPLRK